MGEFFSSIFSYFTDKSKKLTHKSIVVLSIAVLLLVVDNSLSFTYYYNSQRQIEQVVLLNSAIRDTLLSSQERGILIEKRKQIVSRKTWKEKMFDRLTSIDFSFDSKSKINNQPSSNSLGKVVQRDYWAHFLTSGWSFIILIVLLPFVVLFTKEIKFYQGLGLLILMEPLLYFCAWIFAKLYSYIPIIDNTPLYNYILNILLTLGLIMLIGYLGNINRGKKAN